MGPAVPEGRGAAGSHPAAAAVVTLVLPPQGLGEALAQLVEVQLFDPRQVLGRGPRQDRVLEPGQDLVVDRHLALEIAEEAEAKARS